MFFVYILERSDKKLYIGQTNNLDKRMRRHSNGQVRSTKGYRPLQLAYSEQYLTRREAVLRERHLKSLKDKNMLLKLISSGEVPSSNG